VCVTERPCANGGECYHAMTLEGVNNYYCVCAAGWEGRQCTEEGLSHHLSFVHYELCCRHNTEIDCTNL